MKKTILILILITSIFIMSFSYTKKQLQKKRRENVESLYKTFPTRETASKLFKKWVIPTLKSYKYDTLFPNIEVEDLAMVLNILFITETSIEENDGNWYVCHSDLFALNSLFGVKNSNGVLKNTWEEHDNTRVPTKDRFATYSNIDECLLKWLEFISTERYALFRESSNWSEAILQLKAAGYMTDSNYPNKACSIYNNNLKSLYD